MEQVLVSARRRSPTFPTAPHWRVGGFGLCEVPIALIDALARYAREMAGGRARVPQTRSSVGTTAPWSELPAPHGTTD